MKTHRIKHRKEKSKEGKIKKSLEETLDSANRANKSYGMYVAIRDGYLKDH